MQLGLGNLISKAGGPEQPAILDNNWSVLFDGSADYIELPASNSLITGNNFTISMWHKSTGSNRSYIFATQKASGSTNLSLSIHANGGSNAPGYISAVIWPGSGQGNHNFCTYDGDVDDSTWHHYAFTTTASAQVLYLDGVAVATSSHTFSNSATSDIATIGTLNGADYFPAGSTDEVAIWNRVLTADEISVIYNNQSANKHLDLTKSFGDYSSDDLAGWWRMYDDNFRANGVPQNPDDYSHAIFIRDHANTTLGTTEIWGSNGRSAMAAGTSVLNDAGDAYSSYNSWRFMSCTGTAQTDATDGAYVEIIPSGSGTARTIGRSGTASLKTYQVTIEYRANYEITQIMWNGYTTDTYAFPRTTDSDGDTISSGDPFTKLQFYTHKVSTYDWDLRFASNTTDARFHYKNMTYFEVIDAKTGRGKSIHHGSTQYQSGPGV